MAVDIDVVIENSVRVVDRVSRFGVPMDTFLGNINDDGVYSMEKKPFVFNGIGIKSVNGEFNPSFWGDSLLVGFYINDLERITANNFNGTCGNTRVAEIGLDNLVEINGEHAAHSMFESCPLKEVHIDKLTRIVGDYAAHRMFAGPWDGLGVMERASFNSLEHIEGYYVAGGMFFYLKNLSEVSMPKLRVVRGEAACSYMFESTGLKTYTFESLEEATGRACLSGLFNNCQELETVYFPKLKIVDETAFSERYEWAPDTPYNNAFENCPKLREIHFRADMEDVIKGLFGYGQKWGATNAQIIFDL